MSVIREPSLRLVPWTPDQVRGDSLGCIPDGRTSKLICRPGRAKPYPGSITQMLRWTPARTYAWPEITVAECLIREFIKQRQDAFAPATVIGLELDFGGGAALLDNRIKGRQKVGLVLAEGINPGPAC